MMNSIDLQEACEQYLTWLDDPQIDDPKHMLRLSYPMMSDEEAGFVSSLDRAYDAVGIENAVNDFLAGRQIG